MAWADTLYRVLRRLMSGKYIVAVRDDARVSYPRKYVR